MRARYIKHCTGCDSHIVIEVDVDNVKAISAPKFGFTCKCGKINEGELQEYRHP